MTTQATHTPGPWSVSIDRDKYDSSRDVIRVRAEEDRNHPQGPLTVSRINQYLADESVANARLIAAAPELLEALKVAAWSLLKHQPPRAPQDPSTDASHALSIASAAIAKAEGRAE